MTRTAEDAEGAENAERRKRLDALTETIIGASISVHKGLGPGLLESTYEACLTYELSKRGVPVERQKPIPVIYESVRISCGYRSDLWVDNLVIVELKSVDRLLPLHDAQLLAYLKLSGIRVGLLINFNVRALHHGIRRLVNGY